MFKFSIIIYIIILLLWVPQPLFIHRNDSVPETKHFSIATLDDWWPVTFKSQRDKWFYLTLKGAMRWPKECLRRYNGVKFQAASSSQYDIKQSRQKMLKACREKQLIWSGRSIDLQQLYYPLENVVVKVIFNLSKPGATLQLWNLWHIHFTKIQLGIHFDVIAKSQWSLKCNLSLFRFHNRPEYSL